MPGLDDLALSCSKFDMIRSEVGHSVFYCHNAPNRCSYLIVDVDDIVITRDDEEGICQLKQHLLRHFQTKGLVKLKHFLGIEVSQT